MTTTLYRYEIEYKSYDDDTQVYLREYPVIKETESTYLIKVNYSFNKRVFKNAMNSYAYNNKEDAREHFIRRTKKRVAWYKFWIRECKKGLELIKNK